MKIAFIINSLGGGGAERVLQTLCNYLVNHGHEIIVILLESEKIQYEMDEKVKIITLKSSFLVKGIGKIVFIPIQAIELHFLLKKLGIKNAISFLVRSNLTFVLSKFFSNRKVIISERNYSKIQYELKKLKNILINFLIKKFYKKADMIIPISNGIKESLIYDYGLNKSKLITIHNPSNIYFIKKYKIVKIKFTFKSDIKYFITLGRLIPQKDHITMIKAFKRVNLKYPKTNLIILGEGFLRKHLEELIKKLDLEDKVYLLGYQENAFSYLKQADIFVFSSKFEGFGNVIVEAMACELPIISTNCLSGPSEILDNGKYGILTKVGDIQNLSVAMLKMLEKDIFLKYKKLSLKRANDFDVSIIAKEYLELLKHS